MARDKKQTGNTYDINAYRRRQKLKKLRGRLIALGAALTLVGAALAALYLYQNYDLNQLAQTVTQGNTNTPAVTTDQFPVELNGVSPVALTKVGNGVVLLTAEETIFLDGGGSARYRFNHQYTNPVVKAAGGRLLTYDRGGYGFRIDSEGGLHYSARMDNTILTGAMSEKLGYALAVTESRYAGSVAVYNKQNKELLRWYSVSDQIIDLSFSDDGNTLAVACVTFTEGDLAARVYLLDLSHPSEAEKASYTFQGAMPVSVNIKAGGSIHLLCDNQLAIIDENGSQLSQDLNGAISGCTYTGNATWLLCSDGGNSSYSIARVDEDGERQSVQARGTGLDIVADGKDLYVLQKGAVSRYNSGLEPVEQLPVGTDVFAIEASDGGVYLLSASRLDRWRENAGQAGGESAGSPAEASGP